MLSCPASRFIIWYTKGSASSITEIYGLLNASGGLSAIWSSVGLALRRGCMEEFLYSIGCTPETEDPSNKLLDLEIQAAVAAGDWICGRGLLLEVGGNWRCWWDGRGKPAKASP